MDTNQSTVKFLWWSQNNFEREHLLSETHLKQKLDGSDMSPIVWAFEYYVSPWWLFWEA